MPSGKVVANTHIDQYGSVIFEDHRIEVEGAIESAIVAALVESAGEIMSHAMRNTKADTGQLKSSWEYKVDEGKNEAIIGSNLENAIWNEFGTGQWALHGDGRKTPWKYVDRRGEYHTTTGKRPRRTLHNAAESCLSKIQKHFKDEFGVRLK